MSHKTFSIRIPIEVADPLEAEASKEERTLNRQLTVILRDRYNKTHAPPIIPTQTRPARAKANTARAKRNNDGI